MEEKFNFFIGVDPADIEKAKKFEKDDDRRYENMIFEGVASDSSVDTDGESMEPSGFDISYFKKSGLFNHKSRKPEISLLGRRAFGCKSNQ